MRPYIHTFHCCMLRMIRYKARIKLKAKRQSDFMAPFSKSAKLPSNNCIDFSDNIIPKPDILREKFANTNCYCVESSFQIRYQLICDCGIVRQSD